MAITYRIALTSRGIFLAVGSRRPDEETAHYPAEDFGPIHVRRNEKLTPCARPHPGRNDSGGRQRRCGAARARQDLKAGAGREARASAGMFNGRQANQGSADQRRSR